MEANETLEKIVSEFTKAMHEVEARALAEIVKVAHLFESVMEEIAPGIRGIALDEPCAWESAGYRPVLTMAGFFRQDLLSRYNGHPAYFLVDKEEWGGLAPISANQVVDDFEAWHILEDLRYALKEHTTQAQAGAVEA